MNYVWKEIETEEEFLETFGPGATGYYPPHICRERFFETL